MKSGILACNQHGHGPNSGKILWLNENRFGRSSAGSSSSPAFCTSHDLFPLTPTLSLGPNDAVPENEKAHACSAKSGGASFRLGEREASDQRTCSDAVPLWCRVAANDS